MGTRRCPEHGVRGGPLCCQHIAHALEMRAEIPGHITFVALVDAREGVHCRACNACAAEFGIRDGQRVPLEDENGTDLLPYVAPVCGICFKQLMAHQR